MQSNTSRQIVRVSALSAAVLGVFAQQGLSARYIAGTVVAPTLIDTSWTNNFVSNNSSLLGTDANGNTSRGGSGDVALAWNNAAGGAWGTASNWTPNQVPTVADDATFGLASTYVTTLATGSNANRVIASSGNVTLSGGTLNTASLTAAGTGTDVGAIGILAGTTGGPATTLTFNGGAKVTYQSAFAGQSNTAQGKLVISGVGTEFIGVAGGSRLGTFAGNSSLEVINGATTSGRVLHLGRSTAGTGVNTTALIGSGATVNLNPNNIATPQAPGTFVGDSANSVTALTLDNGKIVTTGGIGSFMDIGSGAGSNATVTLKNGSQVTLVGDNTGATTSRGEISLGIDTLNVGSTATLNIESGSTYQATSLFTGLIGATSGAPTSNLNIKDAGSSLRTDYFFSVNGGGAAPVIGTANINVTNGGKLSSGYFNINERGGVSGSPALATANILVDGVGSVFEAFNGTGFQNSYILLGAGSYTTTHATVSNGGVMQAVDTDGTGGSFMSVAQEIDSIASLTVNTNGKVITGASFGVGEGRNSVAALTIASAGRVEFGGQVVIAGTDYLADGTTGATSTVNISGGGKFVYAGATSANTFIALDRDDTANITVSGAGSEMSNPGGGLSFGGGNQTDEDFTAGGGKTNLTINNGGLVSSELVLLARDPSATAANAVTTVFNIDGAGSTFLAAGADDTTVAGISGGTIQTAIGLEDEFGFEIEGSGDATFSTVTLNISNGGLMKSEEASFLADQASGTFTLNLSGASTYDAGQLLSINGSAVLDSIATITVSGGSTLKATGSTTAASGQILFGAFEPILPFGTTKTTVNLSGAGTLLTTGDLFIGAFVNETSGAEELGTPADVSAGAGTTITLTDDLTLGSNSLLATGGTVTVAGDSNVGGTYTISGGAPSLGRVNAYGTGVIKLTNPTAATPTLLKTKNVLIASTAKIDVGKNAMHIRPEGVTPTDTDLTKVKAFLALGRITTGDGGITSTGLLAGQAVGYKLVTPLNNPGTFLGTTTVVGDILVRSTWRGDADLNGSVNFDDLLVLAQNYNAAGTGEWYTGDFTFDSNVSFDDLLALAQNYNLNLVGSVEGQFVTGTFGGDWALAMSMVPEPTSIAALGMGAALLGRRRSR